MNKHSLLAVIKKRRKDLKLTQVQLSRQCKVSQSKISKYENQNQSLTFGQLINIATVLKFKITINAGVITLEENK